MEYGDPVKVAGNVYKPLMENGKVRVLEVKFKPGDKAVMHSHPDHVLYVLNGSNIKMTTGNKTNDMELKTGQVMFLEAQSHEVVNVGKSNLDLIVVELKK